MSKEKDHSKPSSQSCWKDNQNKKHARDNWRRIVEDLDLWEESSTHIVVKDDVIRDGKGKYDLLSVGTDKEALYKRDPSSAVYQLNRDDENYLKHKDGVWLIYQCTEDFHSRPIQNDYYRLSSKGQYCEGEFII